MLTVSSRFYFDWQEYNASCCASNRNIANQSELFLYQRAIVHIIASESTHLSQFHALNCMIVLPRGVFGRVPVFQSGGPCSIPAGIRNFNFYPWIECVSLVCVVSGGGPGIVLTTYLGRPAFVYLSSVLIPRWLLSLQASDTWAFGL